MDITETVEPRTRAAWRAWLESHHDTAREIWLLYRTGKGVADHEISYLDAVEQALCFGWVDGLAKRHGDLSAQRFTPRRPRSHWTELNKERARRLIASGDMTDAGHRTLPDLDPAAFHMPEDVEAALRADPEVWRNFSAFPEAYQRVRVGNLAEVSGRDPKTFTERLTKLIDNTRNNKMVGNWDDSGLRRSCP